MHRSRISTPPYRKGDKSRSSALFRRRRGGQDINLIPGSIAKKPPTYPPRDAHELRALDHLETIANECEKLSKIACESEYSSVRVKATEMTSGPTHVWYIFENSPHADSRELARIKLRARGHDV